MPDFSYRLLDFPVRTAAILDLLRDLKARHLGDVSALAAVLNDDALWKELYGYWQEKGWVVPAPHSPLYVFPGPEFTEDLTVRILCGEDPPPPLESDETPGEPPNGNPES